MSYRSVFTNYSTVVVENVGFTIFDVFLSSVVSHKPRHFLLLPLSFDWSLISNCIPDNIIAFLTWCFVITSLEHMHHEQLFAQISWGKFPQSLILWDFERNQSGNPTCCVALSVNVKDWAISTVHSQDIRQKLISAMIKKRIVWGVKCENINLDFGQNKWKIISKKQLSENWLDSIRQASWWKLLKRSH